jgi:hypothetical protein
MSLGSVPADEGAGLLIGILLPKLNVLPASYARIAKSRFNTWLIRAFSDFCHKDKSCENGLPAAAD